MLLPWLFPLLFGLTAAAIVWAAADHADDDETDQPDAPDEGETPDPDLSILNGTADNDTLEGTDGPDVISGLAGNDLMAGGAGEDTLDGGEGTDIMTGGEGDDSLDGGPGIDLITDLVGSDTATGGAGNDFIITLDNLASEANRALGTPDVASGEAGDDRLWGDDGDTLTGGEGADNFSVVIGIEGAEPVVITDLDFNTGSVDTQPDRVNFITADGKLIPKESFFDGTYFVGIGDLPDGQGAGVYFGDGFTSTVVAIIEGHTADELFYNTIWVGNFQPGESGFYDEDDLLTGDAGNNDLFAGPGNDTLIGAGGRDYLDGQTDDDLIIGTDAASDEVTADSLVGGEGMDTLRGDDGDHMAGGDGVDSYEIVVPLDGTDPEPVTIHGYEVISDNGYAEQITLVDAEGNPLDADTASAGIAIDIADDNRSAAVVFEGQVIAVIKDVAPVTFGDPARWLGNLPAPAPPPPVPPAPVSGDLALDITVTGATGTGAFVGSAMFGGNAVFSVNTVQGVLNASYVQAVEGLDITHLRFPAGQGDSGYEAEDGDGFLDITRMETGPGGTPMLREELTVMLEWARDNDIMLTLVVPTLHVPLADYPDYADEMEEFAETVMTEYGDVVEAFEIGNEYWSTIGETEYGQKANMAAIALDQGMQAAGYEGDEQPAIIVQMASLNAGSEFHTSVDDRGFRPRNEDANQTIIDQLSPEAREAIDGVVEHYYYNQHDLAFEDDSSEVRSIDLDYPVWAENFDEDPDLYLTEWNVRTSADDETGLRAASVMAEQMENMLELGADAADVWPVQHNTATDLAGRTGDTILTDAAGRVLNTINGAVFDIMSDSLIGMELIHLDLSADDGSVEINAYQSAEKTVIQVASRSLDPIDLALDLRSILPEFDSATGARITIDRDPNSSDGVHFNRTDGYHEAEYALVDGERYYYNENDVRAEILDEDFDDAELALNLNPFELITVTFHHAGTAPPTVPDPVTPGEVFEGTAQADDIDGTGGDDTIDAAGGDDAVNGGKGDDSIYGGAGADDLKGGAGDDFVTGNEGDDRLYGWAGDDYLKGMEGDDVIAGNEGNDTLLGSKGDDTLRGNEDDDELNGMTGNDVIVGGPGSDTVTGYSGADIFVLAEGDLGGADMVTDFTPGEDLLEISLPGVASVSDLTFTQLGNGVRIGFGSHGALTLEGALQVADVSQPRNFVFSAA